MKNQDKLEKFTKKMEKEDQEQRGEGTTLNVQGVPITFYEKDSY